MLPLIVWESRRKEMYVITNTSLPIPHAVVLGNCRICYHPFLCPVSATDEAHAGVRDDIWGFFITAAALLMPVSPFQRVYDRFR